MKDQEVARLAQVLKAAVRFTGISHRQIEREMGLSTGYLSRIFSGKVELRVQHVLGVCRAIDLPPSAFFEAAYPTRSLGAETKRLVAALQELLPDPDASPAPRPKGARKTVPPPRPPSRRVLRREASSATSRLRRLLENVLEEMEIEEGEIEYEYLEEEEV